MNALRLSEVAALLGVTQAGLDPALSSVAIDSRTPQENGLFVALRGERFDGHDFVGQAQAAGAVAALVDRSGDWDLPCLLVEDTRLALGRLAAALRSRLPVRLVGITGSNGKTTVKEMTASILRQCGPTLSTEGNLNNDIGVPLTLLRLDDQHAYGVIEMGASGQGEIAYLAGLVRPAVGLITNAGPSHLQGFGSLDGVASGKGELLQALPADATAVINAGDAYAPLWRDLAGARPVIDFGIGLATAVSAHAIEGSRFILRTPAGEARVQLPLPGRHNIMNALAAAAAATALAVPLAQIAGGLAATPSVPGRLNRRPALAGAVLLDDSYNANPNSLRVGLEVLAAEAGERWLVLGDMGELGGDARALHAQAGELARALGVQRLFAVGRLAPAAAAAFGRGGEAFENKAALSAHLAESLRPDVTVLIKGSRSSGMEQVVEALLAAESTQAAERG
jgi:UDP-N-acetylmuramoyl-tripeptide--D-alanyl-D-alanine ligase